MDACPDAVLNDDVECFAKRDPHPLVINRSLYPATAIAVFPEGGARIMSTRQTVLIVDRERTIRAALARELKANYEVLVARDGLEAVRIYEAHGEQIGTILIDPRLPRLDGHAVADWVHHIRPDLPIIVMSTAAEELPESNGVLFVRKPFHLPELKRLLRSILTQQPVVQASEGTEKEPNVQVCYHR